MTSKIDDSICPLCQQNNCCNVNASSGCWCMNSQVPEALLAKVPTHLKGITCICNACIRGYLQQQTLSHSAE
ncbi:cysteine-rich CWC family protein [Colwellia sp. TT2012]|uniref:cysteine-rich CWC family protein n=1 Tax=Colwellia sp. TT2012 TaxID=1720342 RepID=UPI0009E7FA7A|nr:cysteine-rich CWC family protein [Colwellia sp. TT2012]